jgi:hypothetical protein
MIDKVLLLLTGFETSIKDRSKSDKAGARVS